MSLALARKYRPKSFAAVAVQSHVSSTLKGAIARRRVANGYLLCGPRGTGKTTLARVLAMALNCDTRGADGARADDGEPCGECASCRRIWSGSSSLDVVEIDAASNRSVDDARDLRERAMYAPSGDDRYKVYIVDEAHMLTREAWNALLKVLEEPPPRVVFVFCTTEPQKIAQAAAPILSRLQRFDLRRIGPAEIRERLAAVLDAEGVPYEPDALGMIARAADGGLRDALSLTDQVLSLGAESRVTGDRVTEALGLVPEDEYLAILDLITARRAGDVFAAVARLADAGVDFGLFLGGLGDVLRALLAVTLGGTPPEIGERLRHALEARREVLAPADLLRMLHALVEAEPRFRRSGQQQLLLETLLVRFALLDRTVDLEEVLRGIGGSGDGSVGGTAGGSGGTPPGDMRPAERRPDGAPERPAPAGAPTGARPAPSAPAAPPARAATADAVARPGGGPPPSRPEARGASASAAAEPRAAGGAGGVATAERSVVAAATLSPAVFAPDVSQLAEWWDDVVEHARSARPLVATALAAALPVAVTSAGVVTVELQEANDAYALALENRRDDVLAAVRSRYPGASRIAVRVPQGTMPAPERLTTETVKSERMATLTRRDPVLGAAIEALDLDLIE